MEKREGVTQEDVCEGNVIEGSGAWQGTLTVPSPRDFPNMGHVKATRVTLAGMKMTARRLPYLGIEMHVLLLDRVLRLMVKLPRDTRPIVARTAGALVGQGGKGRVHLLAVLTKHLRETKIRKITATRIPACLYDCAYGCSLDERNDGLFIFYFDRASFT